VEPVDGPDALASAGPPAVVPFIAEPLPAPLFCCAVAPATGNANKPVASNIEHEIGVIAEPFRRDSHRAQITADVL
jgi:hypothetical protein